MDTHRVFGNLEGVFPKVCLNKDGSRHRIDVKEMLGRVHTSQPEHKVTLNNNNNNIVTPCICFYINNNNY